MGIFKNFNIADWFSFYRILAAPLLLLLLYLGERQIFAVVLMLSYSTDMVDGILARKLKITSPRGSQLDSFGDQITLILGLIGLLIFEGPFIREHLFLIIIGFSPYLLQMLLAFIKYGKATAFHTYLAKISALIQGIFILWGLFLGPLEWLLYLTIAIGILETIEEITLITMYDRWVSDVKGVYWAVHDKQRNQKKQP